MLIQCPDPWQLSGGLKGGSGAAVPLEADRIFDACSGVWNSVTWGQEKGAGLVCVPVSEECSRWWTWHDHMSTGE